MIDLAEFLLARIAEDEEVAVSTPGGGGSWEPGDRCVWRTSPITGLDIITDGSDGEGGCETITVADHVARHDPARVLAECEAKRTVVEDWKHLADRGMSALTAHAEWCCRILACVYADHPDYRDEWRP